MGRNRNKDTLKGGKEMTVNEYQKLAARTINQNLKEGEQSLHALFGMASEVGELQGIFQKYYQGHPMDQEHMKKELGDILWMIAEFCTAYGWDLEEIAQMNIDKLKARYPEGFSGYNSQHRKAGDV